MRAVRKARSVAPAGWGGALGVIGLGLAAPALAQQPGGGLGEPTDVAGTRVQPGYDPSGLQAGPLTILPSLDSRVEYDSNVFARSNDVVGDGSMIFTPSVTLKQTYSDNPLVINVKGQLRRFFDLPRQNDNQVWLAGQKTFAITASDRLMAGANWSDNTVTRGTFLNTLQVGGPLEMQNTQLSLMYQHIGGSMTIEVGGGYSSAHYDDVHLDDGEIVDQSFRNERTYNGSLRLTYGVGGGFSIDAYTSYTRLDFSDTSSLSNRDAYAITVTGGIKYELTSLLYIQADAGIIHYNFENPQYADFQGLALHLSAHWYATPLLTVKLDTAQTTTTGSYSGVDAVAVTTGHVQAIYEVKRNFNLEANAEYQYQNYFNLHEVASAFNGYLAATMKFNRYLSLRGSLTYRTQGAAILAEVPRFHDLVVGLSVTIAR